MKKSLKIIITLKLFLSLAQKNKETYFSKPSDFSRKRKLSFERVVLLLISLIKRSLSLELQEFFVQFGRGVSCSKSAFSQQRKKLKHQFFIDWNKLLVNSFYDIDPETTKRWKGHRLLGVDGSTAYLINAEEIINYFGVQGNDKKEVPMARIMNCYDVLNELSIKSAILPIHCNETFIAEQWIESFSDDMVGIYDRGYASFAFMYMNVLGYEKEKKFVVRCPNEGFYKEVSKFTGSTETDKVVKLTPGYKAVQHLKKLGYKLDGDTEIKIRLIKVILDNGEIEIIATNLFNEKKYPSSEFKELYFKRWPVETEFNMMKNTCQIENFSGHSVEAIKQDFYATIFTMNLQSLLINQCQEEVDIINQNRKHNYKINRNVTMGILKKKVIYVFLGNAPLHILKILKRDFLRELEPVRLGRKVPRDKQIKAIHNKYHTTTNYRRAI